VFTAAAEGGLGWLVVVAAVNTVASLFYYLRWIGPMFRAAPGQAERPAELTARFAALGAAVLSVALGVAAGPLLDAVLGTS